MHRVVCSRITEEPGRRGSRAVVCTCCDAGVWATPSTVELIATGVEPVCTLCAGRGVAASGRRPIFALTTQTSADVAAARKAVADELGLPVERVRASLPALLEAVADAAARQN